MVRRFIGAFRRSRVLALPRLTLFGRSVLLIAAELLANAVCWIVCAILFGRRSETRQILSLALLSWVSAVVYGFPGNNGSLIVCFGSLKHRPSDLGTVSVQFRTSQTAACHLGMIHDGRGPADSTLLCWLVFSGLPSALISLRPTLASWTVGFGFVPC